MNVFPQCLPQALPRCLSPVSDARWGERIFMTDTGQHTERASRPLPSQPEIQTPPCSQLLQGNWLPAPRGTNHEVTEVPEVKQ